MKLAAEAARLEESIRRSLDALADELGVDTSGARVRAAPIDDAAHFAHVEEERLVANAVDARRREFASGRRLAHAVLAELGCAAGPLLPGKRRAPAWPVGVIGSISHARGVAAVVVARNPPFAAVGLDVEGAEALRTELIDTVLTAREKLEFAGAELGATAKLAFVVKECAYKAWSPTLEAVPEFTDVEIEFDAPRERFVARSIPRRDGRIEAMSVCGRCGRRDARVFAVALAVGL